jgi:hypothetical protein
MKTDPQSIPVLKSAVGVATRLKGAHSPEAIEARRALTAAVLEKHIREVVGAAPPLTPEQRAVIASALIPVATAPPIPRKLDGKPAASAPKGGERRRAFPSSFSSGVEAVSLVSNEAVR